ncbi:myosin-M heavy chain-like [Dendropsophus ebraccatus]|uniref:myosin-M heavy chain-like n=1 Tax=Dendropsophus ebraccatus TaxID=150705 RepID=UPI0038312D60
MDAQHHHDCLQGPLYLLQHPCAKLPCPSAMTYIRADETHEHSRVIPSPQNYLLCTNHGLEEPSLSSMHPLKNVDCHLAGGQLYPLQACHAGNAPMGTNVEPRLYRSLENLHWAESSVFAHYRSMDSEFILHCRSTRHLSEGSAGNMSPQGLSERDGGHRDLPAPPLAKVHQWLFLTADDKVSYGDAKRELKEKLRTHSSKVVEPNRPVRPQACLADCTAREAANKLCQHCKHKAPCSAISAGHPALTSSTMPASRPCTSLLHHRTSPEHIKQEARRRLQLRRQHSSPNLTLYQEETESKGLEKSKTTESFKEQRPSPVVVADTRRLSSTGRFHIPTFEEFKKMRSKQKNGLSKSDVHFQSSDSSTDTTSKPDASSDQTAIPDSPSTDQTQDSKANALLGPSRPDLTDPGDRLIVQDSSLDHRAHPSCRPAFTAPICSSPVSRFPLQVLNMHSTKEELVVCEPHVSDTSSSSGFPGMAEQGLSSEAHSSCCPSLLLEATDLSGYGAKLQKMKDGLIGSALDLIKKSCSSESAETTSSASCDTPKSDPVQERQSCQSPTVPMATKTCKKTSNNELTPEPKSSICSPGCRRSSSDMTHEAGESGKAQRGCRLRPHFSDPMPTDAVKRKQLELKIAAAARHHAQKRRQDRENGPVLMKANTTTSCSSNKDSTYTTGHSYRSRHRWSNISSLSTDSGIVGVNDEREECEGNTRPVKPGEVERVDSGIGDALSRKWRARVAEASASLEAWEAHRPCIDCGESNSCMDSGSRGKRRETLCVKCVNRRMERKEAVLEFVNTESSYGEDLRIIKEEFYLPMQTAGLLTREQLAVVFSNIQELIELNEKFLEVLQEEIDQAFDQGDDDLMTICIGEIFLEFVNMLPAFQTYCLQQPTSMATLNTLEKEKELLRIFLDVSQNDNTALRRMNLRSFLMAPLQRVTKYPLLLSRILKSTTEFHPDHSSLWEAKSRIESHLEHINMKTRQEGNTWTLRSFRRESRKNREVTNIEMREMAIKQVGWPREETRFIKEGLLQMAQPTDGQWVKKGCKALKFHNVHALLMVNVKRTSDSGLEGGPTDRTVKDAVLVLIKDKSNGKFVMLRDPLRLAHCVVSTDPDCEDTFELLEIRKEGFVFRDSDNSRTQHWFQQMKTYSSELGSWRKRRNALPNIMISTAQNRS